MSPSCGALNALFSAHSATLPHRYQLDRLSPVLGVSPSKLAVLDTECRPPALAHTTRMKHLHAPATLFAPTTYAWRVRTGAGVPMQI